MAMLHVHGPTTFYPGHTAHLCLSGSSKHATVPCQTRHSYPRAAQSPAWASWTQPFTVAVPIAHDESKIAPACGMLHAVNRCLLAGPGKTSCRPDKDMELPFSGFALLRLPRSDSLDFTLGCRHQVFRIVGQQT